MLSLSGDQIDSAYEQVFGNDFSCYEPQPPPKSAPRGPSRPPQAPRRPPRPPGRSALRPQRATAARRAPNTAAANTALTAGGSRTTTRKRIIFSDRQASTSDRPRSAPPTSATAPNARDAADISSSLSDISASSPTLSTTLPGSTAPAAKGDFLSPAAVPRMHLYYGNQAKPPARSPAVTDVLPATPPPPPAAPPVSVRPSTAPPATSAPSTKPTQSQPTQSQHQHSPARLSETAPSSAHLGASATRSDAANVFDRLAGDASCGTTTLGKRVLQWAKGAGLPLNPADAAWRSLHLFAAAPERHERLWRRTCAKARHQLSRFAQGRLGLSGPGPKSPSAGGSRETSVAHPPMHRDPHQSSGKSCSGPRGRPTPAPLSTPGGLRAYRCREEYKRWCFWQLSHFYEMGSPYLTSVWRMSPLLGRRYPRSAAGAATGSVDVSATGVLAGIFDGRYSVPCAASISDALQACKTQDARAKILLRLLMQENASTEQAEEDQAGGFPQKSTGLDGAESDDSEGNVQEDDEADDDHNDVYRGVSESRRSSEAVAATEPFLDVRLDEATGFLHLSLYVNGDGAGNGADYVGSSVAACVDNHRWVVLKGLWAREVMFFHFHRPSLPDKPDDGAGHYSEEEEQRVSRRSQLVDGFVWRGIAFAKEQPLHAAATGHDSFVCSRCGRLRSRHNDAYVSKTTGRVVRGYYYCVLCHRRTHHVHLPPTASLTGHVEEVLRASREQQHCAGSSAALTTPAATPKSVLTVVSPASTAMLFRSVGLLPSPAPSRGPSQLSVSQHSGTALDVAVAAKAVQEWTRAAAAAARPAWQSAARVNSDELLGRLRGLSCPPPLPHY